MYGCAGAVPQADTDEFFSGACVQASLVVPDPGIPDDGLCIVSVNVDPDVEVEGNLLKMLSAPVQFATRDHGPVGKGEVIRLGIGNGTVRDRTCDPPVFSIMHDQLGRGAGIGGIERTNVQPDEGQLARVRIDPADHCG